MIKQFSAGDITVRPFQTFKNWNIQSVVSGAVDQYGYPTYFQNLVEINEGIKFEASFSIDDQSIHLENISVWCTEPPTRCFIKTKIIQLSCLG